MSKRAYLWEDMLRFGRRLIQYRPDIYLTSGRMTATKVRRPCR